VTDDGTGDPDGSAPRWIEVGGRRWRATDPKVPGDLRQELVDELMRARRAVRALGAQGDPELLRLARRQVHAAKVALGERGDPWWEPATEGGLHERMRSVALALAGSRAPHGTVEVDDVVRVVAGVAPSIARSELDELVRHAMAELRAEPDVRVERAGRCSIGPGLKAGPS
jgi:hypothetical protein